MKRKQTPPKAPGASGKKQPKKTERPTKKKAARGRPTDYKPEHAEQAYKLCLLGATDKQIADFFQIDERTVNRWKGEYDEFCQSMTRGKEMADAEIAHALYHRAKGYSHAAVKIMQDKGDPVVVPYTEHYPPDTPAASLWLRNRQPKKWRDKVELVGGSAVDDQPIHVVEQAWETTRAALEQKLRQIVSGAAEA